MSKFRTNPYLAGCLMLAMTVAAAAQSADFNNDGMFDCDDIDQLTTEVASGQNSTRFDLNADGLVNRLDVTEWLIVAGNANIGQPYLLGDVNLDGGVYGGDWSGALNGNIFTTVSDWCSGDINADGVVDVSDAMIVQNNINQARDPALPVGEGESLIPSDLAAFIYDPSDGKMYMRSMAALTGMTVAGPTPVEILSFEGFDFRDGLVWGHSIYFAGKHQWNAHVVIPGTGNSGLGFHLLAQYEPGLSESDFGTVEYGAHHLVQDLEGVLSTNVQVDTVLPGDANLDGFVDVADFNLWNSNRQVEFATWGDGDFNADGFVDVSDFNIWNENKFTSAGWDDEPTVCLLYTSPSPRDRQKSRMPSSA